MLRFDIDFSVIFLQSLHGFQEGYDMQDLVLIQTFIGLSMAIGIVAGGSVINKTCHLAQYRKIKISRQYVCQVNRPAPIIYCRMRMHDMNENHSIDLLLLPACTCDISLAYDHPRQYICNKICMMISTMRIPFFLQGCVTLSAISMLVLSTVGEHHYFCLVAWIYGLSLGAYRYTFKMLALERIRGKHFTKAWGKY